MKVCKRTYVWDGEQAVGMKFAFGNGKVHEVRWTDFPEHVRAMAMAHGFNQTLGDSYSGSDGNADVAEGFFLTRIETLKSDWKAEGKGSAVADEDLAQALAELTGADIEKARKAVAEGDKAWKDVRRKRKDVSAIIAKRVADRKLAKAEDAEEDVDDLL